MFPVVTAKEMKEIDRRAIAEWGISGLVLMENAGRAVVDVIEKELGGVKDKYFLVLCGKGNNGGDGFVITRHLLNRRAKVDCLLLGKVDELKGDARTNAQILLNSGFTIQVVVKPEEIYRLGVNRFRLSAVVDAIFGTGLSSPPEGIFAEAIRFINGANCYVVSVDVPSGVDADTGKVFEPAVQADLTVTMGLPKSGLLFYPGKKNTGKLLVADIGIPYQLLEENATAFLVDQEFVRSHLPPRQPEGHKGTFGTVLLICGSRGFSGAAVLSANAAVRAGAGLVRIAYPRSLTNVIESNAIEPVKHPLPETDAGTLSDNALEPLLELAESADSIAIGPGISTHPKTQNLLLKLLPSLKKPTIIDADGLNNLAGCLDTLAQVKAPLILTPHPGELSRLIGKSPGEINSDRLGIAKNFAHTHHCILVLKGASTVVASPDGKSWINSTGNSGLASGGTGDVLTGLIAGFIAQGVTPLDAAIIGVYLHGYTADLAVLELTEYALTAQDLLNYLPKAIRKILKPVGEGERD